MDDNLKLWKWKNKEYLTLHAATCLILGADPDDVPLFEFEAIKELPEYSDVHAYIMADIETFVYREQSHVSLRMEDFGMPLVKITNLNGLLIELGKIFGGNNCFPELKTLSFPDRIPDYRIKPSAIKQWLKLKGMQSEYFDEYVNEQDKKARCLNIKQLKKKDDLFDAMVFHINEYEKQKGETPSLNTLWEIMIKANLQQWGLVYENDKIGKTDFQAFKDRYGRYYPKPGNK